MAPNEMNRMRISDAERDQVSEVLREAAAEGRITLDELDERISATYDAKTYADLEPITQDLPEAGTSAGVPSTYTASAVPAAHTGGQPLVIKAKGSPLVRRGQWHVPHRVEVSNKYGSTRLDFREALLAGPVVEVHVDSSWGGSDIILPEGATAEVDVDASWFGTLRSDVDSLRKPGAPHFVVTGVCQGGSMRIRHKSASVWSIFGG